MTTQRLLYFYLALMSALFAWGWLAPKQLELLLEQPALYMPTKFVHILAVALFFANAVIGTIWETRSMLSGRVEIIRYTYRTVVWLDAVFTAPLILLSVMSGLVLGTILGGVWSMGWLSLAFLLFLSTGVVWIIADIPTQYRINRLFKTLSDGSGPLPPALRRLLWLRTGVNAAGVIPLLVILYLMVAKPEVESLTELFQAASRFFGYHTTN